MLSMAARALSSRVLPNSFSLSGMLPKVLEISGAAWAGAGPAQKMRGGTEISVLGALRMRFQGWERKSLKVIFGGHGVRLGGGGGGPGGAGRGY